MKPIWFLLCAIVFASCEQGTIKVERAAYFWKSDEWEMSDREVNICDTLQIQKMYVKFFEVDHNGEMGNFPISKTRLGSYGLNHFRDSSVVPVVYLRNIVFQKSTREELDVLADNVNFLINKYCEEDFEDAKIKEFQMDCDWTPKTKDNYFYFLERLRALSGKEISCTLRLYPYKYREAMGVPPVDKVTLMCYNLLSPLENRDKNSILDLEELESYLKDTPKYPMHVDVALPIYSWGMVFHNEVFTDILYTDTKALKSVLKEQSPMWFDVIKDTVVNETYLRIGDKIKYEEVNASKISDAISILQNYIALENPITVSFFHIDEQQFNNYTHEELSSIYTDFSK
jgi:hypothetical protein